MGADNVEKKRPLMPPAEGSEMTIDGLLDKFEAEFETQIKPYLAKGDDLDEATRGKKMERLDIVVREATNIKNITRDDETRKKAEELEQKGLELMRDVTGLPELE